MNRNNTLNIDKRPHGLLILITVCSMFFHPNKDLGVVYISVETYILNHTLNTLMPGISLFFSVNLILPCGVASIVLRSSP